MLVYVSGKYTARDRDAIESNIQAAREIAMALWERGHAVICPHTNTGHFECGATYDDYIRGDLTMVAVCDALVMVPGWEESRGANIERDYALTLSIPVYYAPDYPPLHITEQRCPAQARAFREIVGRMYRTHLSKNADYSPMNILGTGFIGLVTRLWDKIARLMNLTGFCVQISASDFRAPLEPKHESIDDTLLDAAVYAVIGYMLRRGAWGK